MKKVQTIFIEKPILLELIGNVEGKKVLDLGCCDAKFRYELLQKGCISYDGVEGSENMVREAPEWHRGESAIQVLQWKSGILKLIS